MLDCTIKLTSQASEVSGTEYIKKVKAPQVQYLNSLLAQGWDGSIMRVIFLESWKLNLGFEPDLIGFFE